MSKKTEIISLERLKQLLSYDPETGHWTWLVSRTNSKIGDIAGYKTKAGYIQIMIDYRNYFGHRLAWFYMTGDWPRLKLDHINTVRDDNRWENLRLATNSQNGANASKKSTNTTGFKGVIHAKGGKKFAARLTKDRKVYCLGVFDTAEQAHEAYVRAAKLLHGEFARAA